MRDDHIGAKRDDYRDIRAERRQRVGGLWFGEERTNHAGTLRHCSKVIRLYGDARETRLRQGDCRSRTGSESLDMGERSDRRNRNRCTGDVGIQRQPQQQRPGGSRACSGRSRRTRCGPNHVEIAGSRPENAPREAPALAARNSAENVTATQPSTPEAFRCSECRRQSGTAVAGEGVAKPRLTNGRVNRGDARLGPAMLASAPLTKCSGWTYCWPVPACSRRYFRSRPPSHNSSAPMAHAAGQTSRETRICSGLVLTPRRSLIFPIRGEPTA